MVRGEQSEEVEGRLGEGEGAGAVELKDGATGADEVRWLAWGEGAILASAAVHKHKEPRPGWVDGWMGGWAGGKTGLTG